MPLMVVVEVPVLVTNTLAKTAVRKRASAGNISALHYATTLFERNVWLLRQLALWMREDARFSVA